MLPRSRPHVELTALSGWTVAAWICFGLALMEAIVVGGWWLSTRPARADPHVGSAAELFVLVGTGIAWMIALAFAALGTLVGLIGAARSARPRRAAWAAVILNGAVVAVSLVLLFALSSQ